MNALNEQQWPEYLMLRDTGLSDDAGGLGQRIFTTAGAGYVKQKYIRADLVALRAAAPGIDLEQFRKPVEFWMAHSKQMMPGMSTTATCEGPRLLALIDASSKEAK